MTIPLKHWLADQAAALGITPHGVRMRLYRGKLAWPRIVRKNKRVILVTGAKQHNAARQTGYRFGKKKG